MKLDPATYDEMTVRPRPGQLVRITYEAEWGCWDAVHRPITHGLTEMSKASTYLAPRYATIEILD